MKRWIVLGLLGLTLVGCQDRSVENVRDALREAMIEQCREQGRVMAWDEEQHKYTCL